MADFSMTINNFCGAGLSFSLDSFRLLYMGIIVLSWILSLAFTPHYLHHYKCKTRYYVFTLVTLFATLGVFAAGDLFTLFLFFEIMSFASYVWVAQDERKESLRAADTYLGVAVIGGLVLLMGLFLLYNAVGTLTISELQTSVEAMNPDKKGYLIAAAFCMFFGFGAKAGAYPLHIWLPKAHPVAPAPASALLSGVLTKSGVFGIMIITYYVMRGVTFFSTFVLVIGLITMALGALLALLSIDLKRTLACSSMSQIGFILTGIGISALTLEEPALAAEGTVLHMMNHTLVKMTVFLVAGVVYENLHKLDLNEIRGFGRKKPLLGLGFMLGGLSLAGVPGFLGYLSKTMLHEGIVEAGLPSVAATLTEWIFLISGGITLCYMTKLFVCIFLERGKNTFEDKKYMTVVQAVTIMIPALLLPVLGTLYKVITLPLAEASMPFFGFEPLEEVIEFFHFHILKGSLISITIGIVLYFFIVRLLLLKDDYINIWPHWLDLENLIYRPLLLNVIPIVLGTVSRFLDQIVDFIVVVLRKTIYSDKRIEEARIEGNSITHFVGYRIDEAKAKHDHVETVPYNVEKKLNHKQMELKMEMNIIKRSMSFGLLLACIGMFVMMITIIIMMFF